jgi:23S rRNA (guanosine2251-2'-O)-methyltransferase
MESLELPQMDPRVLKATSVKAEDPAASSPEPHALKITAAWKVSAGAAAHMPVARVVNLTKAIESLKERGYYSVGLDGGGDALVGETGFETDPLVVVLGSEGNGLSRLVRETCDSIAGIPMSNMVESLNASVAAGITLYSVARARREAGAAADAK